MENIDEKNEDDRKNIYSRCNCGTACTPNSWSTLIEIMNKSSSEEEMLWYVNQTYKNRWSRSKVLKQFVAQAYQHFIDVSVVMRYHYDFSNGRKTHTP